MKFTCLHNVYFFFYSLLFPYLRMYIDSLLFWATLFCHEQQNARIQFCLVPQWSRSFRSIISFIGYLYCHIHRETRKAISDFFLFFHFCLDFRYPTGMSERKRAENGDCDQAKLDDSLLSTSRSSTTLEIVMDDQSLSNSANEDSNSSHRWVFYIVVNQRSFFLYWKLVFQPKQFNDKQSRAFTTSTEKTIQCAHTWKPEWQQQIFIGCFVCGFKERPEIPSTHWETTTRSNECLSQWIIGINATRSSGNTKTYRKNRDHRNGDTTYASLDFERTNER